MDTPLILTSEALIREAIEAAVHSALVASLPEAVRRATRKPFMTKRELMELTGWSSRQVEYKKERRELSYVRRGRTVLFPTEAVFAYLDAARVPSAHGA